MTSGRESQGEDNPQLKSLLDQLLKGKSATFKAKVRDLVLRQGWDVNDPSFAILIATGKLEVLLEQFPAEFEGLFERYRGEQREAEVGMEQLREELQAVIKGMEALGDRWVVGVAAQVQELRELMELSQDQLRASVQKSLNLAQREREALRLELRQEWELAQKLNLRAVAGLQQRYLQGLLKWGVLAALGVMGLGMVVGWTGHRLALGALDPAGPRQLSLRQWQLLEWAVSREGQLARNLLQWNQGHLQECIAGRVVGGSQLMLSFQDQPVFYGNCVLWVVPPEKRELGDRLN